MKKSIGCAAALALGAFVAAPIHAEGSPSSKHAVAFHDPAVVYEGPPGLIFSQQIKTANGKGLAITVSLECGIYTKNIARSKGLAKTDNYASVKLNVTVDDAPAAPGPITFCRRNTQTSALLSGIFTKPANGTCFILEDVDTDGDLIPDDTIVKVDPDCLEPEETMLLEDSMTANSFTFYYGDTTPGVHTVKVEAEIDESTGVDGEDTEIEDQGATATLGYGSMLIEEIRLSNDAVIEMP